MSCSLAKALVITGITIFVIGIILTIALVVSSFETIESTEVGLDYDTTLMELDETKLYENGRHFIGVAHNFIKYKYTFRLLNLEPIYNQCHLKTLQPERKMAC